MGAQESGKEKRHGVVTLFCRAGFMLAVHFIYR